MKPRKSDRASDHRLDTHMQRRLQADYEAILGLMRHTVVTPDILVSDLGMNKVKAKNRLEQGVKDGKFVYLKGVGWVPARAIQNTTKVEKENVGLTFSLGDLLTDYRDTLEEKGQEKGHKKKIVRSRTILPVKQGRVEEVYTPTEDEAFLMRLVDLLAEEERGYSSTELFRTLDCTYDHIKKVLLDLEKMGFIYRTGKTRGTRWWLG